MTPATQDECKYIIERLTEQDDLSETEQHMFDIACEVYEGYAAASETDTNPPLLTDVMEWLE